MMNTNQLKEILLSQPNKNTTTYAKGTPIMMQGEESMEMFYIVSGKVRTVLMNKNGEEFIISTHGTGECICESSYVLQASGILSIYAEEETTLLEINKESYYEIVRDNPEFSFHMIRSIASKVTLIIDNFERYMSTNVKQRAAYTLLKLAEENGEPTPDGIKITIPLTDQEFGKYTGSRREVICRLFSAFQKEGILTKQNGYIIIQDKEKLKSFID